MKSKVLTALQAVNMIRDDEIVTTTGFIRAMAPEELINALETRYLETGHPKNLTLIHGAAASAHHVGDSCGLNNLAHEGLITRTFSGFYGHNDKLKELIKNNKIEAYNYPLGVIPHLLREFAKGNKGELTKMGLKTYVDPRLEGAKVNDIGKDGYVRVMELDGEEYLYYTAPKPTFALLRATTADEFGNITFEDECVYSLAKVAAMATKNNGGTVIFQVKNLVKGGTLDASQVAVPGILVDHIVVCADPINLHRQTEGIFVSPVNAGHYKVPGMAVPPLPMEARKLLCRRAAMELTPGAVVNLGTGIPEGVGAVAAEEGLADQITLSVESGAIGGTPLAGDDFGATPNAWAMLHEDRMFDLYEGGGLDVAFLGLAQVDARGNVNVSKFKGTIMGCGGFIEISQATRHVVFCGSFTSGGLKVTGEDGKLVILQEGRHSKFVDAVEQVTFSAEFAMENGQDILYVTERAVFRLTADGLELTEIAPGVDLEKDILAHMAFRPTIRNVKLMDERIFRPELVGIRDMVMAKEQ